MLFADGAFARRAPCGLAPIRSVLNYPSATGTNWACPGVDWWSRDVGDRRSERAGQSVHWS